MFQQPVLKQLETSNNILIAGCGGGYDFIGGLPFLFALHQQKKQIYFANLSFTYGLQNVSGKRYTPCCVKVTADTIRTNHPNYDISKEIYFPELLVSKWLKENEKMDVPVFTIERNVGPQQMLKAYQMIVDELKV